MFQVTVMGHVHCNRPIFFFYKFFNIGNTVSDDVVKHQGIETGDSLLGIKENLVAYHKEDQLKKKNVFLITHENYRCFVDLAHYKTNAQNEQKQSQSEPNKALG